MDIDEIVKAFSGDKRFQAVVDGYPADGFPYSYYALDLCGDDKPSTRSDYLIGERTGAFRENICGARSFGTLTFVEQVTVDVELFGRVTGWVYNSGLASPARAYFFSQEQPAPDTMPGLYILLRGRPHHVGQSFEFDPSQVGVAQRG
jgi:hypothetical protein